MLFVERVCIEDIVIVFNFMKLVIIFFLKFIRRFICIIGVFINSGGLRIFLG